MVLQTQGHAPLIITETVLEKALSSHFSRIHKLKIGLARDRWQEERSVDP